jgi:hypothetical protein
MVAVGNRWRRFLPAETAPLLVFCGLVSVLGLANLGRVAVAQETAFWRGGDAVIRQPVPLANGGPEEQSKGQNASSPVGQPPGPVP